MNSLFDRECSSGCESGWTSYLDHEDSYLTPYHSQKIGNDYIKQVEDDDEEDLSMVSDASSGPPHFHNDEYYGNELSNNGFFVHTHSDATLPKNNVKRKKNNEHRRQRVQEQQFSYLDDTASSSNNLAVSNKKTSAENMLDFSQGHSSTQFEGKSRFQEHYGFCKSAVSGTKLQQNQWIERKRVGMR